MVYARLDYVGMNALPTKLRNEVFFYLARQNLISG
jgi:hypothetical protein